MLFVSVLALWGVAASQAADGHGMVVRVDLSGAADATGDVVAQLKAPSGALVELKLLDGGAPPDVTAGDKSYSAAGFVEGDEFEVGLTIGSTKLTGGKVTWKPEDAARDLTLSVSGSTLTAQASSGQAGPAAGGGGGAPQGPPTEVGPGGLAAPTDGGALAPGSTPPGDGVLPAGGTAAGGPTPGGPTPSGPPLAGPGGAPTAGPVAPGSGGGARSATASTDPMLYIGFGVGLLLLTALIYSASRGRAAPSRVEPLPEPGLLGPLTPSLSVGVSAWACASADGADLAGGLLLNLVKHHRVVVAAPAWTPPAVFGGPVYKLDAVDGKPVAELVDDLLDEGGAPVAVLAVGPTDPARLAALAKLLPAGVGAIVVTDSAGETKLPVVHASRVGGAWTFVTPAGELRATLGPGGFVAAG